jgi:hypothetical protein
MFVDVEVDRRRHGGRSAEVGQRHGDEVRPQREIALHLRPPDSNRPAPGQAAGDFITKTPGNQPLLVGIAIRRIEPYDIGGANLLGKQQCRLLERAVGRKRPCVERQRCAAEPCRAPLLNIAGRAQEIVIQDRAPAGLRRRRRLCQCVTTQIELAGYAPAVIDRNQNPLRTFDILVSQSGDFVERDDVGGRTLWRAQAELPQLALRGCHSAVSEPDEA